MFSMIRYMFSGSAGVDLVYALTFGACLTYSCAQILGVGQATEQQVDADFTMRWEYQLLNIFYSEKAITMLSLQRWKDVSALQQQRWARLPLGVMTHPCARYPRSRVASHCGARQRRRTACFDRTRIV